LKGEPDPLEDKASHLKRRATAAVKKGLFAAEERKEKCGEKISLGGGHCYSFGGICGRGKVLKGMLGVGKGVRGSPRKMEDLEVESAGTRRRIGRGQQGGTLKPNRNSIVRGGTLGSSVSDTRVRGYSNVRKNERKMSHH